MKNRYFIISLLSLISVCLFVAGMIVQSNLSKKIVYLDLEETNIVKDEFEHKYTFLPPELSDYIVKLCSELELEDELAVSILLRENPELNFEAMHRNENGTVDLGLWQLNDKYLYTTFTSSFWKFENIELDAFDWKHNTFIALHQIEWLQSRLKVFDDVVMAYNCGYGAVLNRKIPDSTKKYLCSVKNNYNLLKGKYDAGNTKEN